MLIKYKNRSDIELSTNYSKIDVSYKDQINQSFAKLVDNDVAMCPNKDNIPDIWTCYWYNYDINGENSKLYKDLYGYDKGEAVWLNTESLGEFTTSHFQQISTFIQDNIKLNYYMRNLKTYDEQYAFFKKVVSGSITGNSAGQPLYFLGQLSDRIQIKVSLHDGNIDLPTVTSSWADFFNYEISTDNQNRLTSALSSSLSSNLVRHISDYHLSIDFMNAEQLGLIGDILNNCVKRNLSTDLSSISLQNYESHRVQDDLEGFDFVKEFKIKKHQTNSKCLKWYRYWNSGYLEQGGIVCIEDGLFGDLVRYDKNDRRLTIKLPIAYDYVVEPLKKTYQINDEQIDSRVLYIDKRYQVSVTKILNNGIVPYSQHNTYIIGKTELSANFYDTSEIANITNQSFDILIEPQPDNGYDYTYYSFYTCGFIVRKTFYSELWYDAQFDNDDS